MLPNVGLGELVLVVFVLLVVVGPQRLPEIIRAAGKAWRTFQEETSKAKAVLSEAFEEPANEFREALGEPAREIRNLHEESKRTWSGVVDRPDGMPPRAPGSAAVKPADPHAPRPAPAPAPARAPIPDPYADVPVVRDFEDT